MDYNQFREQFDFICLQGLKGEKETWEIQDKKTFKLYDYFELEFRNEFIDKQMKYCDHLLTLQHEHILILKSYTYLFKEDALDDPFCIFFMVFEYSESSLLRELQTLNVKKQHLKPKKFHNLFVSLLKALDYLHAKQICHGNLQSEFVCLHDQKGFKLMPNYKKVFSQQTRKAPDFKKRGNEMKKFVQIQKTKDANLIPKISSKVYISPEIHQKNNCRKGFEVVRIDEFKAEIFSLGMLFLQASNLCDLSSAYKTFSIDFNFLFEQLQILTFQYGEGYANIISKMLCGDPSKRPNANECLELLSQLNVQITGNKEKSIKALPQLIKEDSEKEITLNKKSFEKRKESVLLSLFNSSKQNFQSFDIEDGDENDYTKLIFNTLPQEYQDEIDKYVSKYIKDIEENYVIDSYSDGSRYQGEKFGNQPSGFGIFYWANGERFEGEFKEGKYNGYGIYFWPSGIKHFGQFKNGEISGLGVRYYTDGGIYFGEWSKGKNHGRGNFFWSNGARFSGGFINDNIYGKGILFWPEADGKTVRRYEGLWKDLDKGGIKVSNIQKKAHDDILTEI